MDYLTSQLLQSDEVSHGFFSRHGGVSRTIYKSLNVGLSSQDNPNHVNANRKIASEALGFDEKALISPYQTHSANCVYVNEPPSRTASPIKADALITDTKGLLLGVVTADCLPVLLCEPIAGLVAAIHAGWKGALAGIIENTVRTIETHGGKAAAIQAVIGPAIQASSYQVRQDFYDKIVSECQTHAKFFRSDTQPNKTENKTSYRFDLPNFAASLLRSSGVRYIEVSPEDTCSSPHFFSYRRSRLKAETDYGRQLSAIALR